MRAYQESPSTERIPRAKRDRQERKASIHAYILVYAGWIALFALSLWLVFLLQGNLVNDLFFMRTNAWRLRFISQWSIFVLGIPWILYAFLTEGYLRNGVVRGDVPRRLRKAGTPILLLIALSWGLRFAL